MKITYYVSFAVCIVLLLAGGLYLLVSSRIKDPAETVYYQISDNSLTVNVIKVNPDNILLTTVKQEGDIMSAGLCGINGGFFAPLSSKIPGPLSIAINDHAPVRKPELRDGSTDPYQNTGWYNAWGNNGGAGTIIYDKISKELKFLTLNNGYEIAEYITDTKSYWAQGGIDFALGKSDWLEIMREQGLSNYLEAVVTYRSAIGINNGMVYLFTTESQCSLEEFRNIVLEHLGKRSAALLLDGYLCSQMLAVSNCRKITWTKIFCDKCL